MAQITVKDASNADIAVELPNANGRADADDSRPVVLSDQDKAALDVIATAANQDDQTALLSSIDESLATPVSALPHQPLDTTSDLTVTHVTRSTSGETSAVSATASQTTRVHRITIMVAGAVTVELLDGSGGTSLRKWVFPAAGGLVLDFSERPYAKTSANTALYVKTNAAVAVDVTLDYVKSA